MDAAVRVLREELHWLHRAYSRAGADLANPRVPVDLARQYVARLAQEIGEVEEAIECLTCDLDTAYQPPLPFDSAPLAVLSEAA